MTTRRRLVGLLALCGMLSGCGAYVQVPLLDDPVDPDDPAGADVRRDGPETGDRVRVALLDGRLVQGRCLEASSDSLVVESGDDATFRLGRDRVGTLEVFREPPPWFYAMVIGASAALVAYRILHADDVFSPDPD